MNTLTVEKTTRRTQPDNANCPVLRSKLAKIQLQLQQLRQPEN